MLIKLPAQYWYPAPCQHLAQTRGLPGTGVLRPHPTLWALSSPSYTIFVGFVFIILSSTELFPSTCRHAIIPLTLKRFLKLIVSLPPGHWCSPLQPVPSSSLSFQSCLGFLHSTGRAAVEVTKDPHVAVGSQSSSCPAYRQVAARNQTLYPPLTSLVFPFTLFCGLLLHILQTQSTGVVQHLIPGPWSSSLLNPLGSYQASCLKDHLEADDSSLGLSPEFRPLGDTE